MLRRNESFWNAVPEFVAAAVGAYAYAGGAAGNAGLWATVAAVQHLTGATALRASMARAACTEPPAPPASRPAADLPLAVRCLTLG